MNQNASNGAVARLLKKTLRIEENEIAATLLAFLFVFILMTAYSILKPVRDALAGDWGEVGLATTWTVNFVFSLVAVSVYGAVLSRFSFRYVVPAVYAFFSATFLLLWAVTVTVAEPALFNKFFYVWVSVFSLFHLSVFWSFMADLFDKGQAARLFGFIAAGTSLGAIVGPSLTVLLSGPLGNNGLMLASAAMLLVPIPIILVLERLRATRLGHPGGTRAAPGSQGLGRNPFSGFRLFFTHRFLLLIGLFILLYVTISTFVYFELQNLTGEYGIDTRTQIWGTIELVTNALTLLTAAFVTSHIVTRLGMPVALGLMPALVAVGVLVLVAAPTLVALAAFQVLRRVGNYAITRPSREMLFTVVSREARFKAKPVIDIVLYRGGDMLTAWVFTGLSTGLGLGLAGIAVVISLVAAAWTLVAVWLGRTFDRVTPEERADIEAAVKHA
ncbi:MAG TPA: MFS transporter [Woeseiaceae bacterium]|nr:MFS transporter [Woeseiaceae bacterium]